MAKERLAQAEDRKNLTRLVDNYDYASISALRGFAVRDEAKEGGDKYRGGEYVFGTVMGEPWASTETGLPKEFWRDTTGFLAERGYFEISGKPKPGDIVGYALESLAPLYPTSAEVVWDMERIRSRPFYEHFGILAEDNRVVSKFTVGPVYSHEMDQVPTHWGETVYFLRKFSAGEYVPGRDWSWGLSEVEYNPEENSVVVKGEKRKLEGVMVDLMKFVSVNQNRAITWEEIAEALKSGMPRSAVNRRINQLRNLIEANPKNPSNIRGIWGKGSYSVSGIILQ